MPILTSPPQRRAFLRTSKPPWAAATMWPPYPGTTAAEDRCTEWRLWEPMATWTSAAPTTTSAIWRVCTVETITQLLWRQRTATARATRAKVWWSRLVCKDFHRFCEFRNTIIYKYVQVSFPKLHTTNSYDVALKRLYKKSQISLYIKNYTFASIFSSIFIFCTWSSCR